MTDVPPPPLPPSVPAVSTTPTGTDTRTLAIVVYGLYLGALFCGGVSGIAGVILAYIKRDEARGTIWESHFENAIRAFWVWFILFVVGIATAWFLVGFVVIGAAFVYFLYRTIKGLIAAVDSKPYV
ncbi:MAG TPA: DUF4870 domain-containing protein [Rhizomicrobium sp.]|jgi:uncharacterized membrane protein|nr:DUF4870 domain-containing protein [Rhizomicrobium sp.]